MLYPYQMQNNFRHGIQISRGQSYHSRGVDVVFSCEPLEQNTWEKTDRMFLGPTGTSEAGSVLKIGSLSTRVFETRTATGREHFAG